MEPHSPREPGGVGPRRLGDFELLREIGRGGMGVVYEARQVSLNRPVALKLLPPGLGLTSQAVQRFQREAQAAAKLHHTHIVPVYAVGETDGSHYYAMELIDGQPLTAIVRELRGGGSNLLEPAPTRTAGETPEPMHDSVAAEATTSLGGTSLSDSSSGSRRWFEKVARLVAEVANALHYAHGRGIVHRDIKPANLLLASDGRLCVTDFGLAQVAQEPGMTVSGSFLGTPAYMSPEQIAAGRIKVDHRTDIYSLGTVLYELLTLERPFPGEGREQILAGIMTKEPKAPRRINPRIPQDLETICLKAIEKDPDRRYASAEAMAEDLRAYLGHGLITARRAGPVRRAAKWGRRHPVAVTAAAGLVAIAAIAAILQSRTTGERVQREVAEARVLLGNGQYRQALAGVNEALDKAPASVEARGVLAQVLLHIEHYPEAVREANAVLEAEPDDWTAHAVVATAASLGPIAGVDFEAHASAVERLAPRSADALYLRSLLTEDPREKSRLLDGALEIDPSHALALAARASHLAENWKDFPDAVATAERLIAVRPRSALGRRTLASVRSSAGDLDGATREIEKAIALDPADPANFELRAGLRSMRGENHEAVEDLGRAIEIDPLGGNAYVVRARYRRNLGSIDEAIADATQAIKINPDSPQANQILIRALKQDPSRTAEHREAIVRFEKVAETQSIPEHRAAAFRALAFLSLGDTDRALDYIERAIRALPEGFTGGDSMSPGRADLFQTRIAFLRDRDGAAAIVDDCKRLAALAPVTPPEFTNRGWMLYRECSRPDLALADYDRAIELAPQWGEAFRVRASLHRTEGHFDAALADLGRAVELTPWNAGARADRGGVLADLEREEEALPDFEAAAASALGGNVGGWAYADALVRLGRGDEALEVVDLSLARKHGNQSRGPWDWLSRVFILSRVGRVEDALAAVGDGQEAFPRSPELHLARASLLHLLPGRCDEAEDELRQAEERGSEVLYFGSSLRGWIAAEWAIGFARSCPGRYDAERAYRLAERGVSADPRDVAAHLALAYASYRRGELVRAREEADAARKLVKAPKDDFPQVHFLLAMVSAKRGDRPGAKEAFAQGVKRMERTYPKDPALQLVRDEATEVIAASGGREGR